jgi:predicted lipoprotein with Yx(FWY)xxD motif
MHDALKRTPLLLTILAGLALAAFAAGCGDSDSDQSQSEPQSSADAASTETGGSDDAAQQAEQPKPKPKPEKKGVTITLAGSQFGEVLFDGDSRAIYLFDKEKSSESECYGDCAVEWPPVLTKGDPQAKGGVSGGKLGTTKRDDGTTQVTYDGQPLYYYQDDPDGVVGCHNIPGFGGLWLALDASGNPV